MTRTRHSCSNAIVVLLVAVSTANAATDISLREQVETSTSVVRLGDVAEVVGLDRQQARRLAALPLMPAPAPGTQRFLRKREVEDLLAAHGVDLQTVRINGAAQVTIVAGDVGRTEGEHANAGAARPLMNRHAAVLAGQSGAGDATKLDAEQTNDLREHVRGIVVSYLKSKTAQAAAWDVTCDVAERHLATLEAATSPPVCQGGSPPWTGRQRFVISFTTNEGTVQVPVYVEVKLPSAPVVVAVQPIARGAVFTAAHVELRTVDYVPRANERRVAVEAIEKLIGMEARQPIQADDIVFTDQVQAPVLVKRGDLITVSSQTSGIRVRTTARAREDGVEGQLVQLESLETRERFDARVVGNRQATIVAITTPTLSEPSERIETARRQY